MAPRSNRATVLICIAIFIVAFGIRLCGIGWGLKNELHNQSYHPDEPLIFDFAHKSNLFRGPQEKEYYNYGTLYYAILKSADFMHQAYGGTQAPESLNLQDIKTPKQWDDLNTYVSDFHRSGRIASALAGAGTAVLIFLILSRWITTLGALAGAALITFAPAHVEHSRFQTVDAIALFFLALATLFCLRLLRDDLTDSKRWGWEVALAGALAGLAAGTRFTNVLIVLPVLVALVIRRPKGWMLYGAIALISAAVFFIVATPGSVTDTAYFLDNQRFQANHAATGHGLVFVGTPPAAIMTIQNLMAGISAAAALIGLAGLLYAAVRKHVWAWVLLAFFVPYYLSLARLEVKFVRYGFPLYVGVAAGFGYAISALQRRLNSRWVAAGVGALAMVGFEHPQSGVRGTWAFSKWMMGTDPRDEAGAYLKQIGSKDPQVGVGIIGDSPWFWTAAVVKDADFIKFQPPDVRAKVLAGAQAPRVVPFITGALPEYATYSSYEFEDVIRLKDRTDIPANAMSDVVQGNKQLDALHTAYNEDKVYGADGPTLHDLEYIRPRIYVLKRKDVP